MPEIRRIVLVLAVIAAVCGFLLAAMPLPEPNLPWAFGFAATDENNGSAGLVGKVVAVPYDQIPDSLKKAVVAVEDKRFFRHKGIEISSIGRAFLINLKAGEVVEGGSTITQQLAKNLFLTQDRTLKRKLIEAVYAIKLEMSYSKEEILGMYLNVIYFGHGSYGCETASELYFGKPVQELTLAESAMMAGIIKGPEIYSPYYSPDLAEQRKIVVLDLMVKQGDIDHSLAEKAKKEKVKLNGELKRPGGTHSDTDDSWGLVQAYGNFGFAGSFAPRPVFAGMYAERTG